MEDRTPLMACVSKIISCFTAIFLLVFLQVAPDALASDYGHKTPKDSFLKVQANSVNALVNEIRSNPNVRARYVKLYHLPPIKIITYFQKNVQIGRLAHDYSHTVYCITPDGVIFTVRETLKEGDQVFALRSGRPVLRWACGNPFTAALPMNTRLTAMSGTVVFTGYRDEHAHAAISPTNQHSKRQSGKPLREVVNKSQLIDQKVSPYVTTLAPAPPVTPAPLGGPAHFLISVTEHTPLHIPLTPFVAAIPVLVMGKHKLTPHTPGFPPPSIPGVFSIPPTVPTNPFEPNTPATTPEPGPTTTFLIGGFGLGFGVYLARRRQSAASRSQRG